MNRRTAITALLAGGPMASLYTQIEPWKPDTTKTYAAIGHDGRMEVFLDSLRCLRVTFGGESIDIGAEEIFAALRAKEAGE